MNFETHQNAIVLAPNAFNTPNAKTAHGLVRYSQRFKICGVVDSRHAGKDAGKVLEGKESGIPIFSSIEEAAEKVDDATVCIVGIALHGGGISEELRKYITQAIEKGLSVVNGLHQYLNEDPRLVELAKAKGVELYDIRRPKAKSELRFWSGEIMNLKVPRIAILGMDCNIGKRTTSRLLESACKAAGIKTEMIYTGQTGWSQGGQFGIIFDSLPNDFVSGELEGAVLDCAQVAKPDLILIEGQSSLQNLSGPCGAEMLLSAQAKGVILQHAPGRKYLEGFESQRIPMPDLKNELELMRLYGAEVLALSLNKEGLSEDELKDWQKRLESETGLPTVCPLHGVERLVEVTQQWMKRHES